MSNLFLEYPKCTTCKKAKKWLQDNSISFEARHIVDENPTKEELINWHKKSGLELKRFFNTSGLVYKQLSLASKLKELSEDEQYNLLSQNGMLVKRPIIVTEESVLVGFKIIEWESLLKK